MDASAVSLAAAVLTDEVLLTCAGCLTVQDVQRALPVSASFVAVLEADQLWRELCRRRWKKKVAPYHLTAERQARLEETRRSWKELYADAEADGARQTLRDVEEVSGLTFDFTFRLSPEHYASRSFRFHEQGYVTGHPNGPQFSYSWRLQGHGGEVTLGPFPVAQVYRRPDWGWCVANCNVILLSIAQLFVGSAPAPPPRRAAGSTFRREVDASTASSWHSLAIALAREGIATDLSMLSLLVRCAHLAGAVCKDPADDDNSESGWESTEWQGSEDMRGKVCVAMAMAVLYRAASVSALALHKAGEPLQLTLRAIRREAERLFGQADDDDAISAR
eukprot:TRINITY_DN50626_c0_g1_i2.p1 TRINITY_DN50626_c0_g1~~TRINITY_DN50626_c0_g1_i2.p1  ORF type:complete len:334 (+),score=40.60 TRINITY_DN50626_c0_g1_i2:93-1094(+)